MQDPPCCLGQRGCCRLVGRWSSSCFPSCFPLFRFPASLHDPDPGLAHKLDCLWDCLCPSFIRARRLLTFFKSPIQLLNSAYILETELLFKFVSDFFQKLNSAYILETEFSSNITTTKHGPFGCSTMLFGAVPGLL